MTDIENKKKLEAKEDLKSQLEESLANGKYKDLFFQDLFSKSWNSEIKPQDVLREIRVLEGLAKPLMEVDSDEKIPIYFLNSNTTEKPDTYFKNNLSATKNETQFNGDKSPLKGLWHKHYFTMNSDFLKKNTDNEIKKHKTNFLAIMAMMVRTSESALTGEWIIFEKKSDINTYLCLASHNDNDDAIYNRMVEGGAIK